MDPRPGGGSVFTAAVRLPASSDASICIIPPPAPENGDQVDVLFLGNSASEARSIELLMASRGAHMKFISGGDAVSWVDQRLADEPVLISSSDASAIVISDTIGEHAAEICKR